MPFLFERAWHDISMHLPRKFALSERANCSLWRRSGILQDAFMMSSTDYSKSLSFNLPDVQLIANHFLCARFLIGDHVEDGKLPLRAELIYPSVLMASCMVRQEDIIEKSPGDVR